MKHIREAAKDAVTEQAHEAERLSHYGNYNKLHVRRDGTVSWFESLNESDDLIDREAPSFCAIQSIVTVGTGSIDCNCDFCNEIAEPGESLDNKWATKEEAVRACIAEYGYQEREDQMLAALECIEVGYFTDEEGE